MKIALCQQVENELEEIAKRNGLVLHACKASIDVPGKLKMVIGYDNSMAESSPSISEMTQSYAAREPVMIRLISDMARNARAIWQPVSVK